MSYVKPLEKRSGAFVEAPDTLRTLGEETDTQSTRGRTGSEGRGAVANPTIHIVADEANKKPAPWTAEAVEELCSGYSREIAWREADAYAFGYADGYRAGVRDTEFDLAEHWSSIVRDVRSRVGRPSYVERRRRELANAKPKTTDYMGKLSFEEYMGVAE